MKSKLIKYGALLLACIALAFVAVAPMQTVTVDRLDWMANLSDDTSLNSLTIPGTHDSGALHSIADVAGKCQTLSVKQQLKAGVRFLDIRLRLVNNQLRVVHSFVDQMTDFDDVLCDIVSFVANHPSEFLLVSIKEDNSPQKSDKAFEEVLEEMLLAHDEVSTLQSLPQTVGEARGKIHVIARYYNASIGLPCYFGWQDDTSFVLDGIYVQDNYNVPTVEEKLSDVHNAYQVALAKQHALVLNYTSCYLAEGFPPIYAGLPAHDVNADTQETMSTQYGNGPLGVVVCDFVTTKLADAIIGRNFR